MCVNVCGLWMVGSMVWFGVWFACKLVTHMTGSGIKGTYTPK